MTPLPPFTVAEPVTLNPRFATWYGAPKCGKTSSVAALPDSCIIMVEYGADAHKCVRTPKVNSVPEFLSTCDRIIAAGKPYKHVIVDSATELEHMCVIQATQDYKASTIGKNFAGTNVCLELDKGSGYNFLRQAFNRCLHKAAQTVPEDGCIHFIAHLRESQLKLGAETNEVTAYSIALTAGCALILASKSDAVGHLTRRTRARPTGMGPIFDDLWVSFKTANAVTCGSNRAHLAGKEFALSLSEDRVPKWDLVFLP